MAQEPRVIEITCCADCPHLDSRWTKPPWDCQEGGMNIYDTDKIHKECPLDTRSMYRKLK